eukprot:TRINITY_DN47494_c0_g1_i1.p1 TRINITY_DN47494_c0_g1~~TRINITY_DN47494_c0_g1_i1.p1  ORF type:complete len:249 (-),score=34.68 TRINITY_DN47494_c0_g1_i1:172-918(-)
MPLPCERYHAFIQIGLMSFTMATAVASVAFGYKLRNDVIAMGENYEGDIQSRNLPCVRHVYDECKMAQVAECAISCCPEGYYCARSPLVDFYCQDYATTCGDRLYCLDYADPVGTSKNKIRRDYTRVAFWTAASYILACIGIFIDLVEWLQTFALPDIMSCKSVDNLASSLTKLLGFALVVGCGTVDVITGLQAALCYNTEGNLMLESAEQNYYLFAVVLFFSAMGSLAEAPISALYGGKLQGATYVK